mgnify:CR=1 FL=1|tara:strand:- start:1977 stop:2780 length:804 start_codon:yes stop_codon:yes gene_type:complete
MSTNKPVAMVFAAALMIAGSLGLAGCTIAAAAPASTGAATAASAEPVVEEAGTDASMREFVTAIYGNDYTTAEALVVPGSAAQKYVAHQKATDTAYKTNGDFTQPLPEEQPTLEFTDGAATAKYPTGESFAWSDFEYDNNGLLASWTTPSGELPGLLWTSEFSGAIAGNTVNLTSAYKSNAGDMYVVLTVTSGAGIDFLMPYQAQFVASDGIAYSAQYYSAPRQSLPASATGYVVVTFPQAPFGGTLYLEGYNLGSTDIWKAEIPVA